MDGFPAPPQPHTAAPGFPPPAPGMPAPAPAVAEEPRAVGRPSGDPERDRERQVAQATRKRIESVIPRKATDARFAIFRLKGPGAGVHARNKPNYEILVSEVETAMREQGVEDTEAFIRERLVEKFGNKGRYEIVMHDHKGRTLNNFAPWTENLEEDPEEEIPVEDEDDPEQDELDERVVNSLVSRMGGGGQIPTPSWQQPPPPPPGAAPEAAIMARELKDALVKQQEKNTDKQEGTFALMMQMQQQQTQMLITILTAGRQEEAARLDRERIERERLERERREHEEKLRMDQEKMEERRREQRNDTFKYVTATLLPLVLPLISKVTEGKQDLVMPLLLDMIKNNGNNSAAKELMTMMNSAAKEQMQLQGEVSRQAIQVSGETNKSMMQHVLGLSQQVTQSMLEAARDDGESDDPIDKFQKLMRVLAPALSALGTAPQPPPPQPPVLSDQAAAALDVANSSNLPQPQVQQALPAPVLPDAEKTRACIHTLMQLETGVIPPAEYLKALDWCAKQLPKPLHNAILAGQQDQVLALTQPIIQQDQVLLTWIMSDDKVIDNLQVSIKTIQRILLGSLDEAAAKVALEAHAKYRSTRPAPPSAPAPQPAPQPAPAAPPRPRVKPARTRMPLGDDEDEPVNNG